MLIFFVDKNFLFVSPGMVYLLTGTYIGGIDISPHDGLTTLSMMAESNGSFVQFTVQYCLKSPSGAENYMTDRHSSIPADKMKKY